MIINLTKNKFTIVDIEFYDILSLYKWHYLSCGYAARRCPITKKYILMHRFITGCGVGNEVDHINHNKLDNRAINLRICTRGENQRNIRKTSANTSGYKGVVWLKNRKVWLAKININNKQIHIAYCKTKEDAALKYNEKAIELFGEFAQLNEVVK